MCCFSWIKSVEKSWIGINFFFWQVVNGLFGCVLKWTLSFSKRFYWTVHNNRLWLHYLLTWDGQICCYTTRLVVSEDCALETTRQLVFENVFFFFFLISLNSWEWQGTVCPFQWPLDDRATLWAIRTIISPCPPLQKGLSTIKVKITERKRDSYTLQCVRWYLFCGWVALS